MLCVEELVFSYKNENVLQDISFEIDCGKFVAILGANGAGKTTLLKCLLGLQRPNFGKIMIGGKDIQKLSIEKLSKLMAYVPQESQLTFNHFVIDIVEMGGAQARSSRTLSKAYKILEKLGIENLALCGYRELSGGQRQLVQIAQALMQDTPFILMDEPTNNLDYGNKLYILDVCRNLKQEGRTIIITSHHPQDVLNFCDKAILLSDGKILVYDDVGISLTSDYIKRIYGINVDIYSQNASYPPQILPHISKRIHSPSNNIF